MTAHFFLILNKFTRNSIILDSLLTNKGVISLISRYTRKQTIQMFLTVHRIIQSFLFQIHVHDKSLQCMSVF